MKKLIVRKKVEVFLLILAVLIFAAAVFFVPGFYTAIAQDYKVMIPTGLLAVTLFFAFLFLLKDLAYLSRKMREFYPLNGLESGRSKQADDFEVINRLSKAYSQRPCPDDMVCILFTLADAEGNPLSSENKEPGTASVSPVFRRFTAILKLAAPDGCLLGRNEQGIWAAVFEHGTPEEAGAYLERVRGRIADNNNRFPKDPILMHSVLVRQSDLHAPSMKELLAAAMKKAAEPAASDSVVPDSVTAESEEKNT
ncbi:MAG: hypothetical protein U0L49_06635 [Eubacterium sp.]|nr:hypothetical protein [Eubacterium sp.]